MKKSPSKPKREPQRFSKNVAAMPRPKAEQESQRKAEKLLSSPIVKTPKPSAGAELVLPQEPPAALAQLKALATYRMDTVVVIGGGAAGMAAAITAARIAAAENRPVRVVLLEKADRVGRKLLATGNGRCNLGHTPVAADNYALWEDSATAKDALKVFLAHRPAEGAAVFLQQLGLLIREEEGRLYPFCGQASMVLDVLRAALEAAGVVTVCGCNVTNIEKTEEGFCLRAEASGMPLPVLQAARVILTAGGAAAPKLGGCRDGYALAQALGHSCTPLAPALVGLQCDLRAKDRDGKPMPLLPGLKGVRAQATASLYDGDTLLCADTGEIQFNENGLSGIPVLQLSLRLPQAAAPRMELDVLPQLSVVRLEAMLQSRCTAAVPLEELLLGTVHKKLGYAAMKCAGLGPLSRTADTLSDPERERLGRCLKQLPVAVLGHQGWDGAQTTLGGVPLTECDPASCASLRCTGLYLAGEVLDCAGECGGFNLDWAFTTGDRAGACALRSL